MKRALIVGELADSHVAAVSQAIENFGGVSPLVIDAPGLAQTSFRLNHSEFTFAGTTVALHDRGRGWLRRYAPSGWGAGVMAGGLDATRKKSFLSFVGSLSRLGNREWLTGLDALLRAEDRLLQLETVDRLGLRTPRTIVTSDGNVAREELGDQFIVKPLATGYFHSRAGPMAVFTSSLNTTDLDRTDFSDAPFVAQEQIEACEHLRVVTVRTMGWAASLNSVGRPVDWRQQDEAHFDWSTSEDSEVVANALAVAAAFNVGFTSQDWIRDERGLVFLDLNPGGQWLFLPDEVSVPATRAIAEYLVGETG